MNALVAALTASAPTRPRQQWSDLGRRLLVALAVVAASGFGVGLLHSPALAETSQQQAGAEAAGTVTPNDRPRRVIAYYFHTSYRCSSCRAIEAYSREAIESAFASELNDGRLVWKLVNFEEKGNEHFVEDYGLYTKSLVLVNEIPGKPDEWKNLEKVWQLLQDKPSFLRYVQEETRGYLAERP